MRQIDYRLFGRRQDRPLKPRQQRLMTELLPEVSVTDTLLTDLSERQIWLELGFGGGEHLAWQAEKNPDVTFIGAEPFINGVAKLLSQIEEKGLKNVFILHGDGRPLVNKLTTGSVGRVFILHPDPWPKKKHFKRRIVSQDLLAELARIIPSGGVLRVASDIPDYVRWTLMQVQVANQKQNAFRWNARCVSDWTVRADDWPQTRYEAKALREGRRPTYLEFNRL